MSEIQLPAQLRGRVTPYKGNGRKLGYPTANIDTDTALPDGVYFGFADLTIYKHHPATIFIGTPTTVGDTERRVEAYLLDIPDEDYYDNPITLTVEHYYRTNKTFDTVDELIKVLKADEIAARQWFKMRERSK